MWNPFSDDSFIAVVKLGFVYHFEGRKGNSCEVVPIDTEPHPKTAYKTKPNYPEDLKLSLKTFRFRVQGDDTEMGVVFRRD